MATVLPDIIEGNGGRLTIRGWEFTRIFTVADLLQSGDAMAIEAVSALNIPIGDPHPSYPLAFALEFNPESIPGQGNAMRVAVLYREFNQDYRVEIGSRRLMIPRTTYQFEPGGDFIPMKVYYKFPSDYKLDEDLQGKTIGQGVKLEAQEYYPTIVISRTEFTSISADSLAGYPIGVRLTGEILIDRSVNFNGRLNTAKWNLRESDPERSWRCEMTASSAEEGLAYRVTYMFTYDPFLWNYTATFKDPNTGEPVEVVDRAVDRPDPLPIDWSLDDLMTKLEFNVFQTQDFSLLELV